MVTTLLIPRIDAGQTPFIDVDEGVVRLILAVARGSEMFELDVLLAIYLCGWVVVTLGLYVAGTRLAARRTTAPHTLGVSALGGALWPLLLVGVVEASSIVVLTKLGAKTTPQMGVLA
ncbi:hypothetical protein [Mycolicibacterium sp. XJ879]